MTKEDCHPGPTMWAGEEPSDEARASFEDHLKQQMAAGRNERLLRLFGSPPPVSDDHVTGLIKRFMKETDPIMKDRNRVRAHRYDAPLVQDPKYAQTVAEVEKQIEVFERYLGDLSIALDGSQYLMNALFLGNAERGAEDLADIIVHGSINDAVNAYGVIPQPPDNEPPYYYYRREKFYASSS